jgi:hypothetical protein
MRCTALLVLIGAAAATGEGAAAEPFGTWKAVSSRSTNPYSGALLLRIEPHPKGEVFTVERTAADGSITSASTILYLDGKAHPFQDTGCVGTQSSWRTDGRTVEIVRQCNNGDHVHYIRRIASPVSEMRLEISEEHRDGLRVERRLVLEKQ